MKVKNPMSRLEELTKNVQCHAMEACLASMKTAKAIVQSNGQIKRALIEAKPGETPLWMKKNFLKT